MADILYIVVPCYNEEEVLPETSRRLRAKLEGLMAAGRIYLSTTALEIKLGILLKCSMGSVPCLAE